MFLRKIIAHGWNNHNHNHHQKKKNVMLTLGSGSLLVGSGMMMMMSSYSSENEGRRNNHALMQAIQQEDNHQTISSAPLYKAGTKSVTTEKWTFYSGKKIQNSKDFVLIGGNGNPELANEISKYLGVELADAKISKFSDGETSVQIHDNVRGKDCFVIQPTCAPVNDNLMELLLTVSCLRRSSARRITVVLPYYGYARADRKLASRAPISARDVAIMLETVGADRIMVVDMHSGQMQGFFSHNVTTDNLPAVKVGALYFSQMRDLEQPIIVTTRSAGVARAKEFRDILVQQSKVKNNPCISDPLIAMVMRPLRNKKNTNDVASTSVKVNAQSFHSVLALRPEEEETSDGDEQPNNNPSQSLLSDIAISTPVTNGGGEEASAKPLQTKVLFQQKVPTTNPKDSSIPQLELVGAGNSVSGHDVIIVTDIVDTARGLSDAAKFLKARGAKRVFAFGSHGLFSDQALERIQEAGIDRVIVSNTVPPHVNESQYQMITRLSLAPMIAEAIRRVHEKESLSEIFE